MNDPRCNMGVGCDEYGVCYAAAHGEPFRCPVEQWRVARYVVVRRRRAARRGVLQL